jgi:hypothetical protein
VNTIHLERPPTEQSEDGDESLNRYIAVAENIAIEFVCIFVLNAEDEQECRELIVRWFLRTDHGVPTKCSIVPVSDEIANFNITSNDDEVCEFLDIALPEERQTQ